MLEAFTDMGKGKVQRRVTFLTKFSACYPRISHRPKRNGSRFTLRLALERSEAFFMMVKVGSI